MTADRWSSARANDWYSRQPWLVGCNFIPSTAVNQLEMWQAETFDPETIDRELGWAAGLGFNTARVFLHDLLWGVDGSLERIETYLSIASKHGIRTMFVLFDDCWHGGARLGPQLPPVPGRHNSRWLQSPGHDVVADVSQWPRLEAYVTGVVSALARDERVLAWDLYNEVTNVFLPAASEGREMDAAAVAAFRSTRKSSHELLLARAFAWARAASPSQPLTASAWMPDSELNALLAELSDVITFHTYEEEGRLLTLIERLRRHGRPIICTEYLARGMDSRFETHLPVFKREQVGCYNWGLVNGKTQTNLAWRPEDSARFAGLWFHDIFRAGGVPFDLGEAAFIRSMTRAT